MLTLQTSIALFCHVEEEAQTVPQIVRRMAQNVQQALLGPYAIPTGSYRTWLYRKLASLDADSPLYLLYIA